MSFILEVNNNIEVQIMERCKHCGGGEVVRDGVTGSGKQRYWCKMCNRRFRIGDEREKYTLAQKLKALKMYTEGMGLRSIERIEGISAPLLVHWIRNFGKILKKKLDSTKIPDDIKELSIVEIDELFTFYQQKHKKPMFGLLWTETGIKLLILQ
jgi:transposase-like protein